MTDKPITDFEGHTVLVGVHMLFTGEDHRIGVGIYDDDDDRQPTPVLELTPDMAARLARDLLIAITDDLFRAAMT